jgi:TolB-like protein/class 3 adenylate cyclase/Flp pilus assembly protein TadD
MQSRVLTLVFTDLADSTALKTERGDSASGDLIQRQRDHVSQLAAAQEGSVVDWAGDGCFLTFESASRAVTFALRLQQIHHYESDLPGVRIGVHMGEVTVRPHEGAQRVEGLAVDLAARLCGLARPGQVLVSGAVQHSAKQRLGIHEFGQPVRWEAYGRYVLKGFDEPVEVREPGLDGISPFSAPAASEKAWPEGQGDIHLADAAATDAPIRKLAVLPLTNLSGDPAQEYFVDAMTEAVITELAKIKALRVISRTSVMRYKHTTMAMKDIAGELGVDGLIEGSVLRAGNDVRITAQLIRGDSDEHVWAEYYDGTVENILKLQKDIALTVADAVQVAVTQDERAQLRSAVRIDPKAYDLFLKASQFGSSWTPDEIRRSFEQFDEVHRLAPDFSRALTLKATAYYFMAMWGLAPSAATFAAARRAARLAVRADDHDDGAHTVLGWIAMAYEWDWDEAAFRLKRALELQPSNHFIYAGLGFLFAILGQPGTGREYALKAVQIDPNNPGAYHNVAMMDFFMRQYESALGGMQKALEVNSRAMPAMTDGALVAACAGEHDTARRFIDSAIELGGEQPHFLAYKAYAHARAGEREQAEALLARLEQARGPSPLLFTDLAMVNGALGRLEAGLDALERAHRDREYLVATLPVHPVYDPFREEPRFRAMLEELSLEGSEVFRTGEL